MNLTDSQPLLCRYADHGDEAAFRQLVEQYIDLVYSTALRRVNGDADLAQDVTQAVFTDLARKAPSLRDVDQLGGWLHRHTGFLASSMIRSEHRRQVREHEAAQMNATPDPAETLWQQMAPMLDETIECLEPSDRQAVLLRFFERRDFRAIGATLGITDDAAQKRVSRAVEKLRTLLLERGVTLTVVVLSSLLVGKAVIAAPSGLAANVSRVALAGAAAGSGLGLALMKLAKSFTAKFVAAAFVAAVALWMYQQSLSNSIGELKSPPLTAADLAGLTNSPAADTSPAPPTASASTTDLSTGDMNTESNLLLLKIVAADSGQPVPNVEFDYFTWINGKVSRNQPLMATRLGVCKVPVPDGTTELVLTSERDGFATTLLDWHIDHGEPIPARYTLKLARSVPIGGQVVGPDGNPVAGAEVGFNNQPDPGLVTHPQSDNFNWPFWETAKTDARGRWQINRIGKEAIRTLYGGATHPDFVGSEFIWPSRSAEAQVQLLAQTCVFTLGHAVTVQGIVKDSSGNPVPRASVQVGNVSAGGTRKTKSKADGTFFIAGCKPGKNNITAQAKGFAATTMDVELADDSSPFEIVIQTGKLLEIRVVDNDGNPVPHAQVWLNTFRNSYPGKNSTSPAQVDFNRQTDATGRLKWDSAPAGDLEFDISATGYMRSDDLAIPADGTEHVIILQSALTISGTVTDATTGQPIPHFRIITGWPDENPIAHTTNATWSTLDRFWLSFDGGKFNYSYEEPVLATTDPQFMFKFEADGYAPFITRPVKATEYNVQFNVTLTPAVSAEISVLAPDGTPGSGADVGLVSPGARISLIPGGISHNNIQSGGTIFLTDNHGQFALPPDPGITKVVVANSQGYAEATPAELAANPVMNLLPWGRIEGTYLTNDQAVANCTLSLEDGSRNAEAFSFDSSFQVKTDNNGQFVFPRVPPGTRLVTRTIYFKNLDGDTGWTERPLQKVTVSPGATATLTIDSTNQIIVGLPGVSANNGN